MSASGFTDAVSYPASKKPRHSSPKSPAHQRASNLVDSNINASELRYSSVLSQPNKLLLTSNSSSHCALAAGRVGDWQDPDASAPGVYDVSAAFDASEVGLGYWGLINFHNDEPMENQITHASPLANHAPIVISRDLRAQFSFSPNLYDGLSNANHIFESTYSSQSTDPSDSTSFRYFESYEDPSFGTSKVSQSTSSFIPDANDFVNFWDPASYIDDVADIGTSLDYQAPGSSEPRQIGADEPSGLLKSAPSISSYHEGSLAYDKYTKRPPLVLSRTFDLHNSDKDDPSRFGPQLEWEHVLTPSSKIEQKSSGNLKPSGSTNFKPHKTGKRKGPLQPENAKKASAMRRRRACWSCWLSKVPCSMEDECYRCKSTKSSLFSGIICSRSHLSDYTNLFFPEVLVSHLHEARIQELIDENVVEFSDATYKMTVSSADIYPPMELCLRRFVPSNQDFLLVRRLDEDSHGHIALVPKYSAPLALPAADVVLFKRKCLQHMKTILAVDQFLEQDDCGKVLDISWKIRRATKRYQQSCNTADATSLLQKAVMLHEMHAFMGRSLTIIDCKELEALFKPFRHTASQSYDFDVPSMLLNREIKHVMHSILRDTTEQVLTLLERKLRTKSKAAWAPCFCTILILSLCSEDLQIALDGFAAYTQLQTSRQLPLSRLKCWEIASQLDGRLLADCRAIFHGIYKSGKGGAGFKSEKVFNPIRDGLDVNGNDGLGQEVHDLIDDMHDVLATHGHEMIESSREPVFNDGVDMMDGHMEFRQRNSGRLVSAFLRSFLEIST